VVAHADLLSEKVSRDEIKHRVRRKRLRKVFRGVYLVGHDDPPAFAIEYAALKFAGPAAALSDVTAAVLYGALPPQVDPTIHLSLKEKRTSPKGIKFHTRDLPEDEIRTIHNDLRITTPERTLLDCAHHAHIERMVADLIRRELTTRAKIERILERHRGERNTARLRKVLDTGPLWSASEMERRFINLLRKAELPLAESNLLMGRTSPDLVWREQRVLVELDSRTFHADWIAQRADRKRDRGRGLAGWTVMRYTTDDLKNRPFVVVAEIAMALAGSRTRSVAA
jgi:very-short-patch-repair endonuclease